MPRLLRDWARAGVTGTLTVTAPEPSELVCTVLVQDGDVVFASRRARRDPTGELFLELFQVPTYDGENDDEVDSIRSQIIGVVTDLFNLPHADLKFRPDIQLTRWPRLRIPFADLMRCGMLAVADTNRVRGWIGNQDKRFVRGEDPFGMFALPADELESAVLEQTYTPRNLDELIEDSGVTEELVVRVLAALMFAGAVEETKEPYVPPVEEDDFYELILATEPIVKGPTGPLMPVTKIEPEPLAVLDPEPEPEPDEPEPDPVYDPQEQAKFWYEAEEKARVVRDGRDFYALLEVDRRANTDAICARYRILATRFHPDRNSRFAPRDEDGRTQLDVIFDALTTAFAVLTKPAFREIYDQELARAERSRAVPVATAPLVKSASGPLPQAEQYVTRPLMPQTSTASVPPAAHAPSTGLTAADWYRRGEEAEAAGDFVRAVAAYEHASILGPERATVQLALGRSLSRLGEEPDRAEAAFVKAVQLAPFSITCYLALGNLYARLGRHDEARAQFKRVLTIKADDPDALAALESLERPGPSAVRRFLGT